jgi:hypothetical protein
MPENSKWDLIQGLKSYYNRSQGDVLFLNLILVKTTKIKVRNSASLWLFYKKISAV